MRTRYRHMCLQSLFVWAVVFATSRSSDAVPLRSRHRTTTPIHSDHSDARNQHANRRMVIVPWTTHTTASGSPPAAQAYRVTMVPVRWTGRENNSPRSPCTGPSWTPPPTVFIFHITLHAPTTWTVRENQTSSTTTRVSNDDYSGMDMWSYDEIPATLKSTDHDMPSVDHDLSADRHDLSANDHDLSTDYHDLSTDYYDLPTDYHIDMCHAMLLSYTYFHGQSYE
ncbi:hypothetical protein AGLY_005384 [Aphis glycines]|uniref:Uncharacterized protein n=1 Tax=Aphis glycines TaxID=307491 RepID=A0A6G0TTX9_APHGL|nr:hypothetical protein AGLY_005384 [Aphis glycines]